MTSNEGAGTGGSGASGRGIEADVVVVGAGLAGLVAAAQAYAAGRRVAVFDQEPEASVGGQAHWSFGGLFLVVGVALGTLNMWLAVRSVARFATSRPSKARFSGSVLGRLAVITVVALVTAWLVRPAGMAIFAGLALFQVLAIVSSMLPLIKEIRQK